MVDSAHYQPLTIVGLLLRFHYPQGDTWKEAAQVLRIIIKGDIEYDEG